MHHPTTSRLALAAACALFISLFGVGCGPQSAASPAGVAGAQPLVAADPGPGGVPPPPATLAPSMVGGTGMTPPTGSTTGYAVAPTAAPSPVYPDAPAPANGNRTDARAAPQGNVRQARAEPPVPSRPVVASASRGEVSSIEPIWDRPQGNGTGAVIGGVLGAVVGNQFGHGNGRALTTVLGAAGGAVAGNNVERNHREGIVGYRVRVRLDNGTTRTYRENEPGDLRVGDRVRIERGQVRRV